MKAKKLLNTLGLLALCLSLNSCASIINGTKQQIAVSSSPSHAKVYLDGEIVGETPTTITAKRKRDHVITISKEGYRTENVQMTRVFSGAVAGNLIFGGLPGWGVDAISGAQYRLMPENVSINLVPLRTEDLPATEAKKDDSFQSVR